MAILGGTFCRITCRLGLQRMTFRAAWWVPLKLRQARGLGWGMLSYAHCHDHTKVVRFSCRVYRDGEREARSVLYGKLHDILVQTSPILTPIDLAPHERCIPARSVNLEESRPTLTEINHKGPWSSHTHYETMAQTSIWLSWPRSTAFKPPRSKNSRYD